jgi:hypothetical protein
MEIEESSLWREIQAITQAGKKPVHYTWEAEIHVNGETIKPLKVLSVDNVQDFELKYADEILLTLAISGGKYTKRIYPFKDAIEITLYRTPIGEMDDSVEDEEKPQSERFVATLIDTGNPLLEANGMNAPDETTLDLTNLFNIEFQLVNKALDQLRMVTVGGIYRNTTGEDVIKAVLTNESKKIKVEGGRLPQGVQMVPGANKKARDHVILPHGLKLVDVAEYVHAKCGGVYSAGMGYYYYGDYWHVYPCYDTTRFNKASNTLTVINVPKNKMPGIERTYRKDGSNLVVLATGEVRFQDDSEVQQLNLGNGVRFAEADKFVEGGVVKTAGNKAVATRGTNTSEFVSSERKSGNNNVRLSSNPINSNSFVEYSKLARRQGSVLTFVWENSLPELLHPGMMVKVLYMLEDEIREVYGVALKAHHFTEVASPGYTETRYVTRTALAVFVQLIKE